MITQEIRNRFFELKDEGYRDFQGALIPTVPREAFIGVRTPALRLLAKEYSRREETQDFLADLPHRYFDENQLHAFLLSEIKDFDRCASEVARFLPFVDNWATCDQMNPAVFRKHKKELLPHLREWLRSPHPYAVRFAIKMLMDHYLGEDFEDRFPAWVASIRSEEYYINMMSAWYFATALAKRYDEVISFLTEGKLSPFVHQKAIRKAIESDRISEEKKAFLRTIKQPK